MAEQLPTWVGCEWFSSDAHKPSDRGGEFSSEMETPERSRSVHPLLEFFDERLVESLP